jgi:hypothetical protein
MHLLTAGLPNRPTRATRRRTETHLRCLVRLHRVRRAAQSERQPLALRPVANAVPIAQAQPADLAPEVALEALQKTAFLSHLYIKTIILPRQARDKQ